MSALQGALGRYHSFVSQHYDEVLEAVAASARRDESLGKVEIGALVAWKRLSANTPWMGNLMATPDDQVRAVTGVAMAAATDADVQTPAAAGDARAALAVLPGFKSGDALASAVLVGLAPERMAVYDRRAQAGLESLGLQLTAQPGRYVRYMALVEQLLDECLASGLAFTAREVDLALYTLGASGREGVAS